jgi:hypothetical protein
MRLRIVAILFLLGGICSAIEIAISLTHNRINFNLGVLGLFICPGLLRRSPGWRTCALVLLWIAMIAIPIISALFIAHPGPLDFKLFGQKIGNVSNEIGICIGLVAFALTLWQYRVLIQPDVRALFTENSL